MAQALLLVILVVYVFLQNIRATLIPSIAIPVSLIGTFAGLLALGFTINTISLFGLILAIGVVVDDAILVVENVERHIADGLEPLKATQVAMAEVGRPIIATTLVLLAVFVPIGFTPGISGRLMEQFAATISIAVAISSVNALTLSPALCVLILKKRSGKPRGLSAWFEATLDRTRTGYVWLVSKLIRAVTFSFVLFIGFFCRDRLVRPQLANRLSASGGSRVVLYRCPASRCGFAAAYQRRFATNRTDYG